MTQTDGGADVRVGVDIGGTFTDIVVVDQGGRLFIRKEPSTPDDPSRAVVHGLEALLAEHGIRPEAVEEIVHGTTVGSNCILEKKGARTGLLTTRGFRDVLEIGRIRTPSMFDLTWDKPEPLVRRHLRLEVEERIGAAGAIVRPLDEDGVRAAGRRFRELDVESIAICFLNSYRNPIHERRAEAILREALPEVDVTASYAVLPELKEYERTSTAVVNAYLRPSIRRYVRGLSEGLRAIGIRAPLLVVTSNGGILSAEAIEARPVFAVGSGPAAGVAGAARLGQALELRDLIAFDMGGTTAKASLVEAGELALTSEYEFRDGLSSPSRFIKGGGYMLKVPAVDIAEVGSGAGSIAWIDAGGVLNVGPHSAGADPGPACYGRGGRRPTVTDANVVLGLLNPEALAGGSLRLEPERAEAAIRRDIAEPLRLSVAEAADGIRRVANAHMARAVRSVTVERGRDPRAFALVAFGGSGPVHAAEIAQALGIRRLIVPILPGVFTAVGMLASDIEHHFVRSHLCRFDRIDFEALAALVAEMRDEGLQTLAADGYPRASTELRFQADVRFLGQGSELTIAFDDATVGPDGLARLGAAFIDEYARTYGDEPDGPLELVNLRLVAVGRRERRLRFDDVRGRLASAPCPAGRRAVYLGGTEGHREVAVHRREDLEGRSFHGPVIVEAYDSTVVVPAGARASCDRVGNLLIELP